MPLPYCNFLGHQFISKEIKRLQYHVSDLILAFAFVYMLSSHIRCLGVHVLYWLIFNLAISLLPYQVI